MKKLFHISLCLIFSAALNAQEASYGSPQDAINGFFEASSASDDSVRQSIFSSLFLADGQINAIIFKEDQSVINKLGSWKKFLGESTSFYNSYDLSFDEVERSINYYEDIAAVHSLAYQTLTEKINPSVIYEQFLWYTFDLIYDGNGWKLASASWINATDNQPIDDALTQDTIWHTLNK